jgi:transcriptional regulator of nitric oxide reductase
VKIFFAFVAACASSAVLLAADRIFTNPKPDAALKQLFPSAVSFSPLTGTPLHYTAYAADPAKSPGTPPLGYAFWTTDMVPQEHGYHGAIHLLVGMKPDGILTGVVVDYHSEPYGYFSVEPKEFAAQFVNKSVRDPFRVGGDVDAVSRATISINSATRAIRDGSRMVARALLTPDAVKK